MSTLHGRNIHILAKLFRSHLIFALRLDQLVVLELSSFLLIRAYFGSEYLGEPFPSEIILLVDELVLIEIQYVRVVRPVLPIFEHELVAEAH